ncbi:hypothetical protein HPP92_007213 [Vanilla planifolia]|uniref:Uncharacterized protein n=1 Tax=Vanilla planifolia TaxID=51239 RepID=A0A835RME3_VANPL|nr:hypothetical protein HPP92_007438 [Vanilla planifolia]KAG0490350.1 hypothetical protein HPP92_007213 [Vanilla planifolia]
MAEDRNKAGVRKVAQNLQNDFLKAQSAFSCYIFAPSSLCSATLSQLLQVLVAVVTLVPLLLGLHLLSLQ